MYRQAIVEGNRKLNELDNTLWIGQSVRYPGHALYGTLQDASIPMDKRIEVPVFEDTQLGISTGLALAGYLPISIFPRIDFLICACNQLVNHLDKMNEMTHGEFNPKVIIRTMVGAKTPLYPGVQHCQNHTEALRLLCPNIPVHELNTTEDVIGAYSNALQCKTSVIIVEKGELYGY